MPISPYPEALLLDDFSNSESPVFRAKKFKGYFVPKTSNDDITLTFTAQGDGGFTKFLIKDDNGDVVDVDSNGDPIAPTSIMYGRFNSVAFVINDSDNTHPTPWYIEATSGLNSYVDLKITSVSLDSTPILFGAVKNDVVSLKFFALGPPVADFHASAISGTPAAAINFVDDSLYVETWSWDFGDGNTSTSQNPSHTYILSGVYTVVLTASSPAGTDSKTRTSYITITDPLSLAPRWGWNGDPLAEIMNRGEGVDITTMTSGIIAISVLNRIPVMIKAPDGSILLITQPLTNFVGDNYSYTVRIKRSTDNGITWSTPYDAYTYLSYVGTSSWLSGGAAVVDYVGVGGQPTSITYFMENGDSTLNHHTILAIRSIDNGLTWTNIAGTPNAATDITSSVNGGFATQAVSSVNTTANTITLTAAHGFADVQAIRFTGSVPGGLTTTRTYFARVTSFASDTFAVYPTGPDAAAPSNIIDITTTGGTFTVKKEWSWNVQTGQGIQLSSNCTHANRLIVPGDHRTIGFDASATGTGVSTSHCIYSDDGGLTWGVLGSLVTSSTNEATIIETTTANKLLMNVRFAGNTTRYQAFSTDGGATWGAATSVAAMQQVSTWASLQRLGSTLILSTPYDTSLATRKQMSIFVSSDEGVTWALQRTIFYRLSAYSSIVPLDDEHGLIVFENGISNHSATIANDNGSYTTSYSTLPWQSMSLFAFNKTWLMGTPDIYAQYYFNSDSTGLANPYGASIIDYGGILNARGFVKSATNTPSYDANGITLSSANDDAIVLTEFSDFNTTASQSITVQVEATIVTSSNGVLASNMTGGTAVGMRLECASGVLKATVYDGSTSTVATGATTINDGVRRVYAMVRNKTTGKLTVYIDGVADSSVVTDSSNSLVTTNGFYLGMNPSGTAQAISAEFHSCRINKSAVATVDLAVSPVTKVTPHTFRNYTAPTPPAFLPSDLSGLETWLNATVDGGESAYADEGWSLTYPLPYYSGARIQSYRDKSPNRYFFNASDYGHNFYQTDTVIGPHIKHQWNAAANTATRWRLQKAPNSTYTFIAGAGPNGNANFAVGMALKINGVSTGPHILLDTQNATSSNSGFLFYIDQTTQKPSFNLGGSTGNYSYIFTSCPAVNNGNWWYLLFVGRGYGSPVDLYYTQYSGTYNPASPNLPAALTKLQSGNVTTPTNTIPAYYLSIGARYDGGSGSNISLKNLVIYSNSTQFSTTDTINATKLANFNVQA
jgi:PKD repeat protein